VRTADWSVFDKVANLVRIFRILPLNMRGTRQTLNGTLEIGIVTIWDGVIDWFGLIAEVAVGEEERQTTGEGL